MGQQSTGPQTIKYEGQITGFFVLFAVVIVVLILIGQPYYNVVRNLDINKPDPRAIPGFLGTNGSIINDLTLLAYIFLMLPAMVIGYTYARRRRFTSHKYTMTTITVVNWAIIAYLMAETYIGAQPSYSKSDPGKLIVPFIHLTTALIAQCIATVSVIRMWLGNILPKWLKYEPIKPQMQIALILWVITALLGIITYLTWHGVPFLSHP